MPRKGEKMSEEHKAKLRAGREKKKQQSNTQAEPPKQVSEDTLTQLMQKIADLEAQIHQKPSPLAALATTAQMTNAQIGPNGITGIQYKYPVEKSHYPDPTERLYNEPALRRFALRDNYVFKWNVEGVTYESHNITYSEPRFVVELYRKIFDEHGEETSQLALVNRQIQHEDELVARIMAEKMKLQFEDFGDLMSEVRYLRIRNWLLELFSPPKIPEQGGATTMVIDGKIVQVFDKTEVIDADRAASIAERM